MSLWYIPFGWLASKFAVTAFGAYTDREELRLREMDTEALIETCTAMLRTYKDLENHPAETPMELLAQGVESLEKTIEDARKGWRLNYRQHNKKIEEAVRVLERRLDMFMRALQLPTRNASEQRLRAQRVAKRE